MGRSFLERWSLLMRRYASSATNAALARLNRRAAPTTKCATFRILEKDPFGGSSPALWWQRWAEEFVAQGKDSPVRLDAALLASDSMQMTFARSFWNYHSTKRVVEFDRSVPLHRNAFEAMLQKSGSEWGKEVVIPAASKENEVAHAYAKVIISSYMSKAVELIIESPPFEPVTQRQMAASIVTSSASSMQRKWSRSS